MSALAVGASTPTHEELLDLSEPAAPVALAGFLLPYGEHGVMLGYADGTWRKWASGPLLRAPWYPTLDPKDRQLIETWHAGWVSDGWEVEHV